MRGLALDKSEGGVKGKLLLSVFFAPLFCQRGWRTKTLEISRGITFGGDRSTHHRFGLNINHDSSMRIEGLQ
jgi:hypothetical protein